MLQSNYKAVSTKNFKKKYIYLNVEITRLGLACTAVIGTIFLAVRDPNNFNSTAEAVLTTVVGGVLGMTVPMYPSNKNDKNLD